MEDPYPLYPGMATHGGFYVAGFAATFPAGTSPSRPDSAGTLTVGLNASGNLCVVQLGASRNLRFDFDPLSTRSLAKALQPGAGFKFSLAQEYIGDVKYLSQVQDRVDPYGAGPTQGITSLQATGGWTIQGLRLEMKGDLGGSSQSFKKPTPDELKQASYWIELDIAWSALRFVLYDHIHLVKAGYVTHAGRPIEEDLYPGLTSVGFRVGGFAALFGKGSEQSRPKDTHDVGVDFIGGRLLVYQTGPDRDPSFAFRVLTTQFLSETIENDASFTFSMAQARIGEVTYVSGAGARDYGGNIDQGIVSLEAAGGWKQKGLRLSMRGELDQASSSKNLTPGEFKQASYRIELSIPWAVLRFLFYKQINFVLSNYGLYGSAAPGSVATAP
jgi:hypothetical protein